MPDLTENYSFKKPKPNEYARPDDFNSNFDSLDKILKRLFDSIPDGVTVDAELSETSENPVQNKVIAAKLKLCETKHTVKTATLSATGWTSLAQEATVSGVKADSTVIVSPDPSSQEVWGKAQIVCTAQAAGKLTFSCKTIPTAAVIANIIILGG